VAAISRMASYSSRGVASGAWLCSRRPVAHGSAGAAPHRSEEVRGADGSIQAGDGLGFIMEIGKGQRRRKLDHALETVLRVGRASFELMAITVTPSGARCAHRAPGAAISP